jgi:hypothetical protein
MVNVVWRWADEPTVTGRLRRQTGGERRMRSEA